MSNEYSQLSNFPVLKRRKSYTKKSRYNQYRKEIREDCQYRCVYCDVHEDEIGGEVVMTLDHFRPKNYPQFKNLENNPLNLLWSCGTCNHHKDNDWPAYGSNSTFVGEKGYIDPFQVDRSEYFGINNDGNLLPLKHPAKYMIDTLDLNREFLRKVRFLRSEIPTTLKELNAVLTKEIEKIRIQIEQANLSTDEKKELAKELERYKKLGDRLPAIYDTLPKK